MEGWGKDKTLCGPPEEEVVHSSPRPLRRWLGRAQGSHHPPLCLSHPGGQFQLPTSPDSGTHHWVHGLNSPLRCSPQDRTGHVGLTTATGCSTIEGGGSSMLQRGWESTWQTPEGCLHGHLLPLCKVAALAWNTHA